MYKKNLNRQFNLSDFNQPMGLQMNPENRWVKKADKIPWDAIEDKYASLFESTTGTVAKPLRMALGSLIIQTEYSFADRELVAQIQENPITSSSSDYLPTKRNRHLSHHCLLNSERD